MNLYTIVASGNGTHERAALSARLAAWHDAMVAHERKIRVRRAAEVCDEECPHADARALWVEAVEMFGERAQELAFLRSRAMVVAEQPFVASEDGVAEAADRGSRVNDSHHTIKARRSKVWSGSSDRTRTATAEL